MTTHLSAYALRLSVETGGYAVDEAARSVHVTALFADRHAAHAAIEQLVQAGFSRDELSVMMCEATHDREFGRPTSDRTSRHARFQGVLGAIVAGLVVVGSPGGLALRAAGPLVGGLVRTTKGVPAALTAAGLDEGQARFVDEGVRLGSIVLGVQASRERARLAGQLLELAGGASTRAA